MFFLIIPLFAQTENLERKELAINKFNMTYIAISHILIPRLCYGIVKTSKSENEKFEETMIAIHAYDNFSVNKTYGLFIRKNFFLSKNTRSNFFFLINGGIDYFQSEPLIFTNDEMIKGMFVNLSMGFGYSIPLGNDSFLRFESDLGLKWFLSNFYVSFVW